MSAVERGCLFLYTSENEDERDGFKTKKVKCFSVISGGIYHAECC